jgi:hypothetical protein
VHCGPPGQNGQGQNDNSQGNENGHGNVSRALLAADRTSSGGGFTVAFVVLMAALSGLVFALRRRIATTR